MFPNIAKRLVGVFTLELEYFLGGRVLAGAAQYTWSVNWLEGSGSKSWQ